MSAEIGIHGWGVAIPRRRLRNQATQEAWGRPAMPGCRWLSGPDEDALTLGVQAALQAAASAAFDPARIDALLFASTTAPFAEKSCAPIIADTLGLRADILCLDLSASRRAGTLALATAGEFIRAGNVRAALVVAADTRVARPGAPDECFCGQAGAAIWVGPAADAKVKIIRHHHRQSSRLDAWRLPEERFPGSGDLRFSRQEIYAPAMQAVLKQALQESGWQPGDIRRVVIYSPDIKSGAALLKKNGFDVKAQYCDRVSAQAGLTGAPHTLLMLIAALEESAPGDRLLMLDHGDGAAAFTLQVEAPPAESLFAAALLPGYDISYNHYLHVNRLLAGAADDGDAFTSEIMASRNQELWRGLVAQRCPACQTVLTLPLPTCPKCAGAAAEFEAFPLQRNGAVFAITHEFYFPAPEPPLGMAVVDLDGGGRLTLQVADENSRLKVGDQVELVFRRLHDAGQRPNYFWKCRAVKGA